MQTFSAMIAMIFLRATWFGFLAVDTHPAAVEHGKKDVNMRMLVS